MNSETNDHAEKPPPFALPWAEVKNGAEDVFNVWCHGSQLEWAERAWAMLEKAGLTTYRGAVEETRVRVRLLALASIYWDFCYHGCEESFGWDDLSEYATENLWIEPFRLGQLVGPAFDSDDYDADNLGLVEGALRHLIIEERPAIGTAVKNGYGDDWTFLKALFASTKLKIEPSEDSDDAPEEDEEPDFTKSAVVMGWIMEGMPSL